MTTLKDVAQHVGVSISTVSRVVNNEATRSVNSETRRKIWEAVTELGYQSNKGNRNTSKGGLQTPISPDAVRVGCIVAVTQNKYNHPYFSGILEGIEKGLQSYGCDLSYVYTGDDLQNPSVINRILHDHPVDGIILVEGLDPSLYKMIRKSIPHVIGVDVSDPQIARVTYDRVEAAKAAVKHLVDKGHTRIAFIGGSGLSQDMEREKRYRGYREALRDADIRYRPEWALNSHWDVEESYQLAKQLLKNEVERPTAIFAASDMMAIAAMRAINECGLRIPDDVAIVGIDNIEFSSYSSPPLSTIHIPKLEIGQIAAKMLVDYIHHKMPIPVKVTVPFEIITRQST